MEQRHALAKANVQPAALRNGQIYLGSVNCKVRTLIFQRQHGVIRFYIRRQHKAVSIKILDLRRGQAHRLYLQGIVGNSTAKFGIPAEQRAVNVRGRHTSLSGQDYRIVCGSTFKGVPAVQHIIVHRAAADGYRIVCCIAAIGMPAVHIIVHRAAADGYRIVFSIAKIGTPAVHIIVQRAAADGYRIVCSITVIGMSAVHYTAYRAAADGYRIVCGRTRIGRPAVHHTIYRAAADGYRIVCDITVPGKSAHNPTAYRTAGKLYGILLHIPGIRETADQLAGYIYVSCPNGIPSHDFPAAHKDVVFRHGAVGCAAAKSRVGLAAGNNRKRRAGTFGDAGFVAPVRNTVYLFIYGYVIIRRIANIVIAFQVPPAVGQDARRRGADRHHRQGRGNMTAVQHGSALAVAFYKFGYRYVTVSRLAPNHFVNLIHRRSSIVFFRLSFRRCRYCLLYIISFTRVRVYVFVFVFGFFACYFSSAVVFPSAIAVTLSLVDASSRTSKGNPPTTADLCKNTLMAADRLTPSSL